MRSLLLISVFAISACGFQLRGTETSSALQSPVYLSDQSTGLIAEQLKRSLNAQGLLAAGTATDALDVLIDTEARSRQTASVGTDNRVREVELLYSVKLSTRRMPEDEYQAEEIRVRREYTSDVTGVLGSANEEEILYEEMGAELVRRLRERIAALTQEASK